MTDPKTPANRATLPVIYLHAKGQERASEAQLQVLLELGLPLCSRLANKDMVQTVHGFDQPRLLLAELAGLFPGRPVILLRAGLQLTGQMLDQLTLLLEPAEEPLALTLLSNAEAGVNPFAGLQAPPGQIKFELADLVSLLAPGQLHTLTSWTDHFVLLSGKAVECLAAKSTDSTLMQSLLAAGGSLKAADHLFLPDPQRKVFETLHLHPHESPRPPAFSELSARLQDWLNAGIDHLPYAGIMGKRATLHITHSWGGGVASWLQSFTRTDSRQIHFQLRSEEAKSGSDYGQRLSLYAANELRCPVASWWLQPPISSVVDTHTIYKEILAEICRRYGIGRVFVSSLVGHSLDALRSGLPTVQILHDHFPIWPLLSVNPQPYLVEAGGVSLTKALQDHSNELKFPDKDAAAWTQICQSYLKTINEFGVRIAAPGSWVLELQNKLEPAFQDFTAKVIPHGFPAMAGLHPVKQKPRKDGRLRMVVLGRMQAGKGQKLLARALPELTKYVQVYLLGTGKSGEEFFGRPGVDVVLDYDREELAAMLAGIGPDFAALLSVVPETFSYTLSELQQLRIPPIATRTGSFPDRIEHAKTGWLIDASATALVSQVAALCDRPRQIQSVRRNLSASQVGTPRKMVNAYNRLCPLPKGTGLFTPVTTGTELVQWAAADYQRTLTGNDLRRARKTQKQLAQEVERRSEWAQETDRQLQLEKQRREQWVTQLEVDISRLQTEADEKSAWALATSKELEFEQQRREQWVTQLEADISRLQTEADEKSAWALTADKQLKLERKQGKAWLKQIKQLTQEVEKRTEWALATSKELELEQQRREQWVRQLEAELETKHSELENTRTELGDRQWELENTRTELGAARSELQDRNVHINQLESDYQKVTEQVELILNSSSWKLTRPLRISRRMTRNFFQARAWNPVRWPWLLSQLVRNLSTLGFTGTLKRMQYSGTQMVPELLPIAGLRPHGDLHAQINFKTASQPQVSIVIPVYNNWDYTAACLQSLQEAGSKYSYEVIIVDDQSNDETAEQLAQIENLKHLRNEKNLGFVGSCNLGARHARGEYLVLLNNDTQVMEGWLDELIDTFEKNPGAGMVGARLVYPDGRLQEAGGIVFNDGSGWNYGRGEDAERPEYHFLREVDYCSGACIALRTRLFHTLGDLDERYAPAYYEDTDLAFKVRASGLKVLVQPLSVVVHHEGITSGTDTASGTKKYQLINQQKFLDKWQKQLELQPDAITDPNDHAAVRQASHHRCKGNILFIDATTPEPDQDSGSVRLTNLLQICKEMGYNVTFFADNRAYTGRYTRKLQRVGIEVLYHPWLESLRDFFSDRGAEFDYIFISRHYIAINYITLLKRYCPKASFIFDTVDLHYLREQRLAELENSNTLKSAAKQTRHSELSVVKAADVTLVVSTVEKEVLAKHAAGELVHVLSNIHHVPGRSKGFADRKDLFFVGGYQHPPNIDAACWFVNEVWPLIHAQLPELQFHLIGSKAPKQVSSLQGNGVIFHGFVESLDPFLSDCRLAVAPLRYGAGVKGKVNLSMAHGQPVVATPAAAEGIFAAHERELLVAEDAETFALEVVRLYQDEELWNRLSEASVRNVEEHFSITAARRSLTTLFDSLKKMDSGSSPE